MNIGLLIASPQLRDPNFTSTVVLICHHDEEGALGVVVNRETPITVAEILRELKMSPAPDRDALRVLWGGPVEQGTGFLVFRGTCDESEGWNLPGGVTVTTNPPRFRELLPGEQPFLMCLGCAGWGPGQLDDEIRQGSWLYTELDPKLLFDEPVGARYEAALGRLGLRATQVWMNPVDE